MTVFLGCSKVLGTGSGTTLVSTEADGSCFTAVAMMGDGWCLSRVLLLLEVEGLEERREGEVVC
jgi:hypothetical protein